MRANKVIFDKQTDNKCLSIFKKVMTSVLTFSMVTSFAMPVMAENNEERTALTYDVGITCTASSAFYGGGRTYSAATPKVITFFDYKGNCNVASYNGKLTIQRFDDKLNYISTIELANPYSTFGNVICDNDGNYYVVWGQSDTNNANAVVTSVTKYSYDGEKLGECTLTGYNSNPYELWGEAGNYWGTKNPFNSGNCSLAINNGILTCNYARTMYSGHQSNFVFNVKCADMTRVKPATTVRYGANPVYCSHSFDQDAYPTSDGGFLYANHGDAFTRGFVVSKADKTTALIGEALTFHFREGMDRSYGYNETYAQLGGVIESDNAYVLCGSSEKTLSLEPNKTNSSFCGHGESRNLFVQILKKDFYKYSGSNMYYAQGETRKATGTKPASSQVELRLSGSEVDYGVIWLTNLSDDYYVNNPKINNLGDGKFVVLWEELSYSTQKGKTYYTVLDETGKTVVAKTLIPNAYLCGNVDVALHDGTIYWATNESNGTKGVLHMFEPSEHIYEIAVSKEATCSTEGSKGYVCKDCKKVWEKVGSVAIPVNPDNHKETEKRNEKVATCVEDGYSGDICCKECNAVILSGMKIALLGHKTEIKNIKEATCSAEGYTGDVWCKTCNTTVSTGKTIDKKAHTFDEGVITVEATTEAVGSKKYTCKVCGETKNVEIPKIGKGVENGWFTDENGNKFWYENYERQGLDGRGKEIFDPESNAWYWLDAVDEGKMATNKDVFQESVAGICGVTDSVDENGNPIKIGKWVRYDENGHMVKGWSADHKYYFDLTYGTMVKGYYTIEGTEYYFDTVTSELKESDIVSGLENYNGWKMIGGKQYWYENGIRQGYSINSAYRGKEIYDAESNAWYWLDNVLGGAKATGKDVYQESLAGDWGDSVDESGNKIGKWVRYDANGHMIKGWQTTSEGTYYFDMIYGTMAKGTVYLDDGKSYTFDMATGKLK